MLGILLTDKREDWYESGPYESEQEVTEIHPTQP